MGKDNYTVENVYQGGYSSLDPNKAYSSNFTGYRTGAGSLGLTTDPRTANIVKDASAKLSSGVKQIELALVSSELFDSVPKQQYAELKELSKLTGINVSVHAPVIDSAGFSQQGFSELNREVAERKITEALMRSHELNPNGNIPVTFHSAEGIAGSEWKTLGDVEGKTKRTAKRLIAVDRDSGKMVPLEFEKKYYPGGNLAEPKTYTPEENLEMANSTEWSNSLTQIEFNRESAERIMQDVHPTFYKLYTKLLTDKNFKDNYNVSSEENDEIKKIYSANQHLNEAEKKARSDFSRAYEIAQRDNDKETMNYLQTVSEQYKKTSGLNDEGKTTVQSLNPKVRSEALFQLSQGLERIQPRLFVPIEEFAKDQSAKTFGNSAFNAFKKFKDADKTPMMVIENPPAGFGLSTGEDLKNLVIASRKQFVDKAKENGMSENEAGKIAEKLIGATWDVGHINMLRKQGFGEKEIIAETEKIAPYVKHVHLSDNFGYEHTELPMGMGNVPMKEIMAKLGEKGFEGKKIIEAGQWWQHFQTNPLKETLEGLGSPMYSSGIGPYWNQSLGLQQGYSSGYGMMLPSNNYQTFGAGFSQLPSELGGEVTRGGSTGRFSQRGME
jgi:sugar phosphate isomerase/epimerase